MRIGIMQPYFFPYIGYFQLINAVDKFVVYDDVTFIKQGWINRNNILLNDKASLFTVPLDGASSNKLIHEIPVRNLAVWRKSFYKTITQNYKKAPFFEPTLKILELVLNTDVPDISRLCFNSLQYTLAYLEINTQVIPSSRIYNNQNLKAQERVIDICLREKALHYINPIGGALLYAPDIFRKNGLALNFLKSRPILYKQFKNEFVPWLSMIDVLMFNSPAEIKQLLNQYDLV